MTFSEKKSKIQVHKSGMRKPLLGVESPSLGGHFKHISLFEKKMGDRPKKIPDFLDLFTYILVVFWPIFSTFFVQF